MPVGDNIRTVEYNNIQSKVSNILGTGSGNLGYGQTVQSSQVTTSNNITVNEWGALKNDIINIYRHQNDAIPTTVQLPEAIEGNSIRYNITNAPVTVWDTFATTLQNARSNALPVGRFSTANAGDGTSGTLTWSNTASMVITFTWASTDAARFFFNSGGRLRVSANLTTTSVYDQSIQWRNFLNSVGTREWGGYFPNTGTTPIDGTNYYRSDSTYRQFYSVNNTATNYTMNTYRLFARKSGASVNIEILLSDTYVDPDPPGQPQAPSDQVVGQLQAVASYTYGAGAMTGLGAATWNGYEPTSVSFGSWSVS